MKHKRDSTRKSATAATSNDGDGLASGADGYGCADFGLEAKVVQLEATLQKFRTEVDMKMSIVEQILTVRNDQFAIQKQLISREQALYESVLSHWKNVADLASSGLSLRFSQHSETELVDVKVLNNEDESAIDPVQIKRKANAGSRKSKRLRRRKQANKETASDGSSDSEDNSHSDGGDEQDMDEMMEHDVDVSNEGIEFEESTQHYNTGVSTEGVNNTGFERKVFVNFYAEDPSLLPPGQQVSKTPIWKYYLREENGETALCKLCDAIGGQTILCCKRGNGTSALHRHIKSRHSDVVDITTLITKNRDKPEWEVEPGKGVGRDSKSLGKKHRWERFKPVEHKKLLFGGRWHCLDRENPDNGHEYWRCARYWRTRCKGRLQVKPDFPPFVFNEHTCPPTEDPELMLKVPSSVKGELKDKERMNLLPQNTESANNDEKINQPITDSAETKHVLDRTDHIVLN